MVVRPLAKISVDIIGAPLRIWKGGIASSLSKVALLARRVEEASGG